MKTSTYHVRAIFFLSFKVLASAASCRAADSFEDVIRKTDPLPPEEERQHLHLPPGFEIQLVASEPEIGKPMNMSFDAQGRLWITQSREYPFAAPLDRPGRDMIKVLSDFDETGRARKVTTFAEGLNIPIGLYPYKDGVIAFSIPNIYYLQDTDGDGRADKKELILGRFGFEKDVHGLTSAFRRGFDGWLYADHGFNNDTTLTAKDGSTITMNSGNCYRFKLDGSHVEQYSHGQVNPFGLMFDPLGDLWSADCHSSPVYQLLRGAYYPSFGKPHDGLGFAPEICAHSHGSTAIGGMVYYAADNFPPEYRGNTFIGNVMTCRINRDSFVEHGSTRIAKEEPDFLSSDDPWFRPVDLQLGPDGAIYVADFYNRIIGHYEVALTHPGRDRERGRIWRISYRLPKTGIPAKGANFDLSRASAAELMRELASPNITRRLLAMNQLTDRLAHEAIAPVTSMLRDPAAVPAQKVHGLWVLHRLNALDEKLLTAAARDASREVRVHAMRVLSETQAWSQGQDKLALAGLTDPDPYVKRAATDALGRHPVFEHIRPLLDLRLRLPKEDSQLTHTARMALRDQLLPPGSLTRLQSQPLTRAESQAVADVALGVPTPEGGAFLLFHLRRSTDEREKVADYLRHAARYAPVAEAAQIAEFARKRFAADLDFQLALFKSIEEGVRQRGAEREPSLTEWGGNLAGQLLASLEGISGTWRNSPLPGAETTNPWNLEHRASADGDQTSQFISSLSPGGEKFTGVLRSAPLVIPAKLEFFMAGHDDPPDRPLGKKNFARLLDASTQAVLAQSSPPRNDLAQRFTWDLSEHAGKKGILEIVDGNSGNAYAWLAVGRFKPTPLPMPSLSPNQADKRQFAAAELAGVLRLTTLEPRMAALLLDRGCDVDVRAAAAKALVAIHAEGHLAGFSNVLSDVSEPMKLRERIAAALGELNSMPAKELLAATLRTAPAGLQSQLGLALASTPEGAEVLLQAVAEGQASPRLLQERNIMDHLAAAKPANLTQRVGQLTANLPRSNEQRQKLVEARRAAFKEGDSSPEKGAAVFKQHCAICHALEGQGALIGPQLDGAGGRGAERLLEDILDPSRNVDRAFRTTLLILNDGDVQSGLFRREEGQMLVLAEATGKEISIPKRDIKERRESETSLMPDNFADVLAPEDLNHLLAFLLDKNRRVEHTINQK